MNTHTVKIEMEIVASSNMTDDKIDAIIEDHVWDIMTQQLEINVREVLVTAEASDATAAPTLLERNPGALYFGGLELPDSIQDIPLAYRRAAQDWVEMIHGQDGTLKLATLLATLAGDLK